MPLPNISSSLDLDQMASRMASLEGALAALEALITSTPTGQALPLPLRLAIRDFGFELAKLTTKRAAATSIARSGGAQTDEHERPKRRGALIADYGAAQRPQRVWPSASVRVHAAARVSR